MSYELVLHEGSQDGAKAVGENVFLADLHAEFPAYIFYYPAEMPDIEFESLLRNLGERTGGNLFVNIGRLDDPGFEKIVSAFQMKSFPSVVLTATSDLAGPADALMNVYVRLDGRIFDSPDRAIKLIENLYLLFLQGEIADAIKKGGRSSRTELIRNVGRFIAAAIGKLGKYVADRDLRVSILDGSFEIKKSG